MTTHPPRTFERKGVERGISRKEIERLKDEFEVYVNTLAGDGNPTRLTRLTVTVEGEVKGSVE